MFTRRLVVQLLIPLMYCSTLFGQQKPETSSPSGVQEFPVLLQQNVTAGKTPPGTKIQGKLRVATLVNGTVIPRNAVFSGEVVESVAKTASEPSRLALRMDSVQWKNGSMSIMVFLTSWYYPTVMGTSPDLRYGPDQPDNKTWNGMGQYPDPNSPANKPFPSSGSEQGSSAPNTSVPTTSNHRVPMKDVESASSSDGMITIVCKRNTIKLDKLTTYVLAVGDLAPAK